MTLHCSFAIASASAILHADVEASWLSGTTCSEVSNESIHSSIMCSGLHTQISFPLIEQVADR